MGFRDSRFSKLTPTLVFSCFVLAFGDLLFGYDTGSFGGMQASKSFINQFGVPNRRGVYALETGTVALFTSLAFIGKLIGCFAAGPLIERIGHRWMFILVAIVSYIGVIVEITAAGSTNGSGRAAQFIVGRIIVYGSIGLVEVTITTYQSETAPALLRGFITQSLQAFLGVGQIIATLVNKYYTSQNNTPAGWKLTTGIQFLWPTIVVICLPFIPDSPRWLISKGRDDDAVVALRRLRPKADVAEGRCEEEIVAIKMALNDHVEKAPWIEMIRGSNLRRTFVVMVFYSFQQLTGTHFGGVYFTSFLNQNGFASKAFTYPIIVSVLSTVTAIVAMQTLDAVGRRPMYMLSAMLQALFLYLIAGLGEAHSTKISYRNGISAAFILYIPSYNLAWGAGPYLTGSEVPIPALREKTQSVGTALNVFWAWLTTYTMPYIISDINYGIGWIFGSLSIAAALFTFFFLPETKGYALEEIGPLFEQPYNPFKARARRADIVEHPITDLENAGAGLAAHLTDSGEAMAEKFNNDVEHVA